MSDPWFKFYPSDWRADPRLRMCGIAARGLWIEMIALMHEASPYGHLLVSGQSPTDTQLAVLAGVPSAQVLPLMGELEAAGVFSRTKAGVIYSRKMTRTAKKAAIARNNGKNGGNPSLRKQSDILPSDIQNPTNGVKAQKPDARSQTDIEPKPQQLDTAARRDRYDRMLDAMLEANGISGFRDERAPGLMNLAPILGLIEAGFDFELDILGGIRSKPNSKARHWRYFEGQIRDYRAMRLGIASKPAPADPATKTADWSADKWRPLVDHWRNTGNWNREALGPAPNEPDCRAPTELLEQARAA